MGGACAVARRGFVFAEVVKTGADAEGKTPFGFDFDLPGRYTYDVQAQVQVLELVQVQAEAEVCLGLGIAPEPEIFFAFLCLLSSSSACCSRLIVCRTACRMPSSSLAPMMVPWTTALSPTLASGGVPACASFELDAWLFEFLGGSAPIQPACGGSELDKRSLFLPLPLDS